MTALRVTALAGGTGGARFLRGLVAHLAERRPGSEITVIGNTADDLVLHGLHVSPDLDTLMYTLGGGIHEQQGWGRADESFAVAEELAAYDVQPRWVTLGDRDIATHVLRTQMLARYSLTEVTAALSRRWLGELPVPVRLLPMSDDRVETHVVVRSTDGARRAIHFQEWWGRHRATLPAEQIVLVGIEHAAPAPGVVQALREADVALISPSNPVVSVGPILSVPGLREVLRATPAPVVGLSPLVGGRPVRGMADACLAAIGVETTTQAVARLFADVLDGWLVDTVDADHVAEIVAAGVPSRAGPLLMSDMGAATAMAQAALALADEVRPWR